MTTAQRASTSQSALLVSSASSNIGARESQLALLVTYAPPSAFKSLDSQMAELVVSSAGANVVAHESQLAMLVVYQTGIPDQARSRAWAFSLDGHEFYVLNLGPEGTWLWDQITGQWCEWETDGYGQWNFINGCMWGDRIVGGDSINSYVWEMDPTAVLDEGWRDITHVVTGGLLTRSRTFVSCDSIRMSGSAGFLDEENGTTITLNFSDDQGKTWSDDFTIALDEDAFDEEIAWRSLGSFSSPGRIFQFTDVGGIIRIDGTDAMVNGFDNDQPTQNQDE